MLEVRGSSAGEGTGGKVCLRENQELENEKGDSGATAVK